MSVQPASITWFASHEFSLFWRDFWGMMTAGRRRRGVVLAIVLVIAALLLHLLAHALVAPWLAQGVVTDKATTISSKKVDTISSTSRNESSGLVSASCWTSSDRIMGNL